MSIDNCFPIVGATPINIPDSPPWTIVEIIDPPPPEPPTLLHWQDIRMADGGKAVLNSQFIGGYPGNGVYLTTDFGATINKIDVGAAFEGMTIASVAISGDGTNIFAMMIDNEVLPTSAIYRTTNDGASWDDITSGTDAEGLFWDNMIVNEDGTLIYAVNTTNSFLMIWTSGVWTISSLFETGWLSSSSNLQIAAATHPGTIDIITDGSLITNVDLSGNAIQVNDVSGNGQYVAASFSFPPRTTHFSIDSGVTFNLSSDFPAIDCAGLAYSSDGTSLYFCGADGPMYKSTDFGDTFTLLAASSSSIHYDMDCSADGSKIIAVTQTAGVEYSTDGGATWNTTLL